MQGFDWVKPCEANYFGISDAGEAFHLFRSMNSLQRRAFIPDSEDSSAF